MSETERPRFYLDTNAKGCDVLMEGRAVWVSDTPREHESQQEAYDKSCGIVWTFGLGLGLFAKIAAAKDDVTKMIVVETEQDVIDLVWHSLDMKDKGKIIHADMWEWLEYAEGPVDFIYVDIWMGCEKDFQEQRAKVKRLCKRFNCKIICWNTAA